MIASLNGLAWRMLSHNRLRLTLTIIAVAFGVSSILGGNIIAQSAHKAVLRSEDLQTIMGGLIGQMDTIMAFVSLVIMLAAGFLVYNAFAMSIAQRRQQIGSLRAIGMTRAQVLRMIVLEALFTSLLGTVLGLLGGPVLGMIGIRAIDALGQGLFAFEMSPPALWTLPLALVLGPGVPLLAVLNPARSAARLSPLEALRPPEAEGVEVPARWRSIVGIGLALVLALHLLLAPPGQWVQFPADANLSVLFVGLWVLATWLLLPGLIGIVGAEGRRIAHSATGRLVSENLLRARRRVTVTVFSLAFGLIVVTAMTGFMDHFLGMFVMVMEPSAERDLLFASHIDPTAGWSALTRLDLSNVLLKDEEYEQIMQAVSDQAEVIPQYFLTVPEISFLGDAYFSFAFDARLAQRLSDALFTFQQGDWPSTLDILSRGCGVLVAPLVAARNHAAYDDTITVTTPAGQVDCTVAGIGTSVGNASIISAPDLDTLGVTRPVMALMIPHLDSDVAAVRDSLAPVMADYPALVFTPVRAMVTAIDDATGIITLSLSGLVVLAVLSSALGVVNTTVMSVDERRSEIALLRAVGATRQQLRRVIVGEAALLGFVGGLLGLVVGLGIVIIVVLVYGSNSFGFQLDLWSRALTTAEHALFIGLMGVVVAPLVAALAAWLPARRILKETPVVSL